MNSSCFLQVFQLLDNKSFYLYTSQDFISRVEMYEAIVLNSMLSLLIMYFRGIRLNQLSSTMSIFWLQSHYCALLNLLNLSDMILKLLPPSSSSSETLGMLLIYSSSFRSNSSSFMKSLAFLILYSCKQSLLIRNFTLSNFLGF